MRYSFSKQGWVVSGLLVGTLIIGCTGEQAANDHNQQDIKTTLVQAPVSNSDGSGLERDEENLSATREYGDVTELSSADPSSSRSSISNKTDSSAPATRPALADYDYGLPKNQPSSVLDGKDLAGKLAPAEAPAQEPAPAGERQLSERLSQNVKLGKGKQANKKESEVKLAKRVSASSGEARPAVQAGLDLRFAQKNFGNTIPSIDGFGSGEKLPGEGKGPGVGGDKFAHVIETPFITVSDEPLSTFSIDVDTASYSKVRSYLMDYGQLPPKDSVRIEELVNYFNYDYEGPDGEHPFAANAEVASCPWNSDHRLVRIGIKGEEIANEDRPSSNLVFLLDVSGSMNRANKLPLLKSGMKMLIDQLGENDRVAIVVYAGAAGLVQESITCDRKAEILSSLDSLQAGGSTNGGAGIQLAYQVALDNFIKGGTNRVILCTDGDFNVGTTSTGGLVRMAEEQAKAGVFLSVMGFGTGNLNDAMMEELSNKANGNYAFIDTLSEARKVLVEQMSGTLLTIAKDVKIQIEFNPKNVAAYRLVGYENRMLAAQDFNDDKKDAGEIGAGHTVTAFYEIVPVGLETEVAKTNVDDLKYQTARKTTKAAKGNELLTLKLRYKQPDENESTLMSYPIEDTGNRFNQASSDFKFAASVAMFGMVLRDSAHDKSTNFDEIMELASSNLGEKPSSYRTEFVELVARAKNMK